MPSRSLVEQGNTVNISIRLFVGCFETFLFNNIMFILGTKELAFVHAVIAAGTMNVLSRACILDSLSSHCACSQESRPDGLPNSHLWIGCGDNLRYGFEFSKMFLDAKEELVEDSLGSMSKVLMNIHNNEAGRWVSDISGVNVWMT